MYTITKGPSKLVAQRRTGPSQQQVESRLGELLKCRQPAPPTPPPPRAQPPGPWPLSRGVCCTVGERWGGAGKAAQSPQAPRRPHLCPQLALSQVGPLRLAVALSAKEDPRAAVGHLNPGRRAGRRDRECLAEWHGQPRTPGSHLLLPGPRLVFNRVNGRRPPATSPSLEGTQETYTLAHEENVRFVSEAWQQVEQQLGGGPAGESGPRPVQYVEKTPNPRLQNFVPIDLDEWWAQQFLARVTNCS
ncbi:MAPK regulated corepressor interacting protein 2 isoform X2 [Hyaena hyaena]|uniref:MAPK regulated corepressor interacting protein 2 isoform X2 n=1 Tax=Hyaena hyaena TaxID=95912 RepID=UPI0019242271|nr:MAPK regulated corepressor interacting protein 2 isoform X2 [Hyaena hyaena]